MAGWQPGTAPNGPHHCHGHRLATKRHSKSTACRGPRPNLQSVRRQPAKHPGVLQFFEKGDLPKADWKCSKLETFGFESVLRQQSIVTFHPAPDSSEANLPTETTSALTIRQQPTPKSSATLLQMPSILVFHMFSGHLSRHFLHHPRPLEDV